MYLPLRFKATQKLQVKYRSKIEVYLVERVQRTENPRATIANANSWKLRFPGKLLMSGVKNKTVNTLYTLRDTRNFCGDGGTGVSGLTLLIVRGQVLLEIRIYTPIWFICGCQWSSNFPCFNLILLLPWSIRCVNIIQLNFVESYGKVRGVARFLQPWLRIDL